MPVVPVSPVTMSSPACLKRGQAVPGSSQRSQDSAGLRAPMVWSVVGFIPGMPRAAAAFLQNAAGGPLPQQGLSAVDTRSWIPISEMQPCAASGASEPCVVGSFLISYLKAPFDILCLKAE